MFKRAILCCGLLFSLVASAADFGGGSLGSGLTSSSGIGVTTQADNYYVDPAGLDTNSCVALASPCLTIQGAINRVKHSSAIYVVKHPVTINLAAGTYSSGLATGIYNVPADAYGTDYSWIYFKGAQVTATPTTGSATGTLTSWSAQSNATFAVATNSGATMTVDDFKGMFLEPLTGTGATNTVAFPAKYEIVGNSATAFTLIGAGLPALAAGTTYRVVRPSVFINAGTTPAISTASPMSLATPKNTSFGLGLVQNQGTGFAVSDIEFTLSSSMLNGIIMQDSRLRIFHCRFIGASGSGPTAIGQGTSTHTNGGLIVFGVYSNMTGSTNGRFFINSTLGGGVSAPGPAFTAVHIVGGIEGINIGGSANGPVVNNCKFETQTVASIVLLGVGVAQMLNLRIDGSATGISSVESSSAGLGNTTFALSGADISNCTVAGITLQSPLVGAYLTNVAGSSNLVGVKMSRGAVAEISSGTSITGTTEATIDGNSTTWVAMRAATRKMIKDVDYLTRVFE